VWHGDTNLLLKLRYSYCQFPAVKNYCTCPITWVWIVFTVTNSDIEYFNSSESTRHCIGKKLLNFLKYHIQTRVMMQLVVDLLMKCGFATIILNCVLVKCEYILDKFKFNNYGNVLSTAEEIHLPCQALAACHLHCVLTCILFNYKLNTEFLFHKCLQTLYICAHCESNSHFPSFIVNNW
jgi:hypothetical protein